MFLAVFSTPNSNSVSKKRWIIYDCSLLYLLLNGTILLSWLGDRIECQETQKTPPPNNDGMIELSLVTHPHPRCAEELQNCNCFHEQMVRCNSHDQMAQRGTELFRFHFHWPSTGDESNSKTLLKLELRADKTAPHFKVFQRALLEGTSLRDTVPITTRVNYPNHHQEEEHRFSWHFPWQFKSVLQMYGSVEGNPDAFVRAVVHFVDCHHVQLAAVIRKTKDLFVIVPHNESGRLSHRMVGNVFDFEPEVFRLFSSNSPAIEMMKGKAKPKYCLIHLLIDRSFHQMMGENYQQSLAYVQFALMLVNEILANGDWELYNSKSNMFALKQVDFDFTVEPKLSEFTNKSLTEWLLRSDDQAWTDLKQKTGLVYLLTARNILQDHPVNEAKIMQGISMVGGAFTDHNVAASSVADCINGQPNRSLWSFRCLMLIAHETLHSLGASHYDKLDGHVMNHANDIPAPVRAAQLKLFSDSTENIERLTYTPNRTAFIPATDWPLDKCGNRIQELGEQCDEGGFGHSGGGGTCCSGDCRLKPHAQCSPSSSLCCDWNSCKFVHMLHPNQTAACLVWNYCPSEEIYCNQETKHRLCSGKQHLLKDEDENDDDVGVDCSRFISSTTTTTTTVVPGTTTTTTTPGYPEEEKRPELEKSWSETIVVYMLEHWILSSLLIGFVFILFAFLWIMNYINRKPAQASHETRQPKGTAEPPQPPDSAVPVDSSGPEKNINDVPLGGETNVKRNPFAQIIKDKLKGLRHRPFANYGTEKNSNTSNIAKEEKGFDSTQIDKVFSEMKKNEHENKGNQN